MLGRDDMAATSARYPPDSQMPIMPDPALLSLLSPGEVKWLRV
jgi:hypothetical protein